MDSLSPQIKEALEASSSARQLFVRLALEYPADVAKLVSIGDVLAILCLAENDMNVMPGDYFQIAKFLAERLA